MSKKQQYTTKFYEDNGGGVQAVTRDENGKVVNVLGGFEDGSFHHRFGSSGSSS